MCLLCLLCSFPAPALVLTSRAAASALPLSAARAAASAATATESRIWRRIHDQSIEEQIDRVRHDLDGVQRGVIECVSGALDQ